MTWGIKLKQCESERESKQAAVHAIAKELASLQCSVRDIYIVELGAINHERMHERKLSSDLLSQSEN